MEFAFSWFRYEPTGFRVVVGDVGTGKTHVSNRIIDWARRVAFERWAQDRNGGSLPVSVFYTARVLSPRDCRQDEFEDVISDMRSASMVVLDDIGTEVDDFKTGAAQSRLLYILNVLRDRYFWVTTNVATESWAQTWGKRIEDRLLSGTVIQIKDTPSYRSERPDHAI